MPSYEQVPEDTKQKLREKIRYQFVDDDWWDAVYEDFIRVTEILGIEIAERKIRGYGKNAIREPAIYFKGFCTQGSHAAYEGSYGYAEGATTKIREYAPQDEELHHIADELATAQVACRLHCADTIVTVIESNMSFDSSIKDDFDDFQENYGPWYAPLEKQIEDALSHLADWLYRRLEAEHDCLTSDEYLDEWLSESDNLSSIYSESEEPA